MGYVEQSDIHLGTTTVHEALMFSANLRLSSSISTADKLRWVDEVLVMLELKEIAHRIVGDAVIPGLSPGQLKRLTIGVELVANPTILFLDEPTSGLDSRAALQVHSPLHSTAEALHSLTPRLAVVDCITMCR